MAATFLRKELCCPGAMTRRRAPQTRYTLRRCTASIMKDFDFAILLCSQDIKKNLCLNSGDRYFYELKPLLAKANGKRPVGQTRSRWTNYI